MHPLICDRGLPYAAAERPREFLRCLHQAPP